MATGLQICPQSEHIWKGGSRPGEDRFWLLHWGPEGRGQASLSSGSPFPSGSVGQHPAGETEPTVFST